jgi:hypothetical protein
LISNNEDKVVYVPSQTDGFICLQEFTATDKTAHVRAKYVIGSVEKELMKDIADLED